MLAEPFPSLFQSLDNQDWTFSDELYSLDPVVAREPEAGPVGAIFKTEPLPYGYDFDTPIFDEDDVKMDLLTSSVGSSLDLPSIVKPEPGFADQPAPFQQLGSVPESFLPVAFQSGYQPSLVPPVHPVFGFPSFPEVQSPQLGPNFPSILPPPHGYYPGFPSFPGSPLLTNNLPEPVRHRPYYHSSMSVLLEEKVVFSQLNTFDFDFCYPQSAPSIRTTPRLPFDISSTFSTAKYTEIFNQFGTQLLLEKHPQLNEDDFKHIEKKGFMYFIKNVKTIVPTIGPWKFLSHVRTGNGSSDRSYNLVGFPIRCKVKEWVVGTDLWRMYHFVKGKTPKQRAHLHL